MTDRSTIVRIADSALLPLILIVVCSCLKDVAATDLAVSPNRIELVGPEASQQVLVTATFAQFPEYHPRRRKDVTRQSKLVVQNPSVVQVSQQGAVVPIADGATTIEVEWENQKITIPVVVRQFRSPPQLSFQHDIVPILSKAGCNSGGCHGKAEGQNGFKLSVFGFDPQSDYDALVKEARGRRVRVSSPRRSLLLTKATATVPHGGGQKVAPGSLWYRRLHRWIASGANNEQSSGRTITRLQVEPAAVVLPINGQQQLRVSAIDDSGRRWSVTPEAEYQTNNEVVAKADQSGLISASDIPGEAAILVRFMGQVAVCRVTIPQLVEQSDLSHADWKKRQHDAMSRASGNKADNPVDTAVWVKLQRLGIPASNLADDSTFLRRVYLDTIGTLPTVKETRAFLANKNTAKRRLLIDQLLQRPEYADFWAMKWADILRVDKSIVSPQGAVAMTRWLRQQIRDNVPYDQFVRQIVTARGNTLRIGPAAFYQVHADAEAASRAISQVFLGVRIECAQCHHHPFEKWSQQDYFAFSGFFNSIKRSKGFSGGQKIVGQAATELVHPRTQQKVGLAPLGAESFTLRNEIDPRHQLATWMTTAKNPFLARMIANRLWSHYFGRGLVEPIDDMRATNPASNEPLLQQLADYLVEHKFDLRQLTRLILNSNTYQLESKALPNNRSDRQNYSHAIWKPLPAEVLLDAICQSTQIPAEFNGWPRGYRAIQVWDNRMPSYFFRVFGRPQRVSVCECERGNEPSIAQALHLMNSPETVRKIRHRDGRAARLAASKLTPKQIIDRLYLATLSRYPAEAERSLMLIAFEAAESRRQAAEDVLWTLLNVRQFTFSR